MKLAARVLALIVMLSGIAAVTLWAQQRPSAEQVKQRLIGSYKLVSYTSFDQNGVATKLPYSVGQISYDAAGRMSAQLQRSDRETLPNPAQGYVAYFGRYEIDAAQKIVSHIVEGSTSATMIGRAMPRHFEFSPDGETLFLSTKTGDRVTGRLRWDRYK